MYLHLCMATYGPVPPKNHTKFKLLSITLNPKVTDRKEPEEEVAHVDPAPEPALTKVSVEVPLVNMPVGPAPVNHIRNQHRRKVQGRRQSRHLNSI